MKKYFSNIRTLTALLMAGAAFAACSSSDDSISINEPQPATPTGEQVYKLTIKASNGNDATRALSLDDSGKLSASWTVGDVLSVSKDGTLLTSTLECTVANGDEATFTGTIQGTVSPDDNLTLTYHPVTGYSAFGNQDGTLSGNTYSAENYDIATAIVTVESVDGENNISIKETTVDFTTQSAMMKLTLTSDGTTAINATSLTVSAASVDVFTLTIPEATYTANGDGILYFALPSAANMASRLAAELSMPEATATTMLASATITFTASEGAATYTATKSGYPFAGGTYYRSTLTMAKSPIDLSQLTAAYKAEDGDVLKGTLGNNVMISIADGAKVTLDNLSINAGGGWTSGNYAGITCEGDAEITLVGVNTVKGINRNYPGIQAGPEGTTLTIKGTGKLTATASNLSNGTAAGIGSDYRGTCGNIEILDGEITATGCKGAAGIGASSAGTCGDIIISGGTIIATGGNTAAGIGAGKSGTIKSSCGKITISGGIVTATGGSSGAGIGTGQGLNSYRCTCDDITINGGTVTATGGKSAAGIGTGGIYCGCGNIFITSDAKSVKATRGTQTASYIGKGSNADYITCGTVTVDGVENATTSSTFAHFDSSVSGNTWTLTGNATE